MCGIAGILQFKSPQNEQAVYHLQAELQQMNDALQHRGPDGEGTWMNDKATIGLAHRRLSIIDLSEAGHQPMQVTGLSNQRYWIIHNGEIYNYLELKKELEKKGYNFKSQTDTEIIAAAYDCWKESCLQYFDGMFAFALWDEEKKELFAARDRFGEKPFFYCTHQNRFLFASEMKALWAVGCDHQPNPKMLFNFLTLGYTGNPHNPAETFYDNIFQLPAASYLQFETRNNNFTIQKYWEVNPRNIDIKEPEAIERFCHLFSLSIQRRLRSDVSIGSSLSGGLDSSSIVATMRANTSAPFSTFTAVFKDFDKDESVFAQKIATQNTTEHYTTCMRVEDLIADWEKLSYHQETPFGSASIYAQYKVYALAKEHGVKVLLDGQGADETIAGYHKFYKWYWQELYIQKKLSTSKELLAAKKLDVKEPFGLPHKLASLFPGLAADILLEIRKRKAFSQKDFTREFVQMQDNKTYYSVPKKFTLNDVLYFHTFTHGLEELLKFADRNSMAHGREIRLPFLSHEMVEFLFSLPPGLKIKNGWTKWLLRRAMQSLLPEEITWRKDKTGFEPPQQEWMQDEKIKEMIQAAKQKLVSHKILKPAILQKVSKAHAANALDGFDWRYLSAAILF